MPGDPQAMVLRVWRHGDDVMARITAAVDSDPFAVSLAGRDEILRWVADWLQFVSGDEAVTQLQRGADD